ncbi:SOS response-associated peptidase [Aureibacillus halotolerans]|uniref:Abasic site processing protein n=1 Tax=Aureibacillus halotolerans TaxID=1508390 RepID=A0A4R6U9Z0_9BACI|nr:SOS response-associated peptidase [Aureibacillus halotolerans]TDQ42642.1 putative SOS response-associated peptidase YedK [Aureibacillus halotolerans]
MCGRFTLTASNEEIAETFQVTIPAENWARYNIAPTQNVLAIVGDANGRKKAGYLRWGLVPSWAKDVNIGHKLINARAETLAEKPAFKRLLPRRRCLIPANSFYEWTRQGDAKQPYRIALEKENVFAFAGLWDRWTDGKEEIVSCVIVTTAPNGFMSPLHDRMPVILSENTQQLWLDAKEKDPSLLTSILVPYVHKMKAYAVSKAVNSPKNEDASVVEPI